MPACLFVGQTLHSNRALHVFYARRVVLTHKTDPFHSNYPDGLELLAAGLFRLIRIEAMAMVRNSGSPLLFYFKL